MLKLIEDGHGLPDYAKDHIIYYASGQDAEGYMVETGPTAGRMDSYVAGSACKRRLVCQSRQGQPQQGRHEAAKKYGSFYRWEVSGSSSDSSNFAFRKVESIGQ
jgi:fumarate hydratase class I